MKLRKQTKLWKMRNGDKVRICDMTDEHLLNTVALIRRLAVKKAEYYQRLPPPQFNGEMAQFYADREWEALQDMHPDELIEECCEEVSPLFENLTLEVERRGLDMGTRA